MKRKLFLKMVLLFTLTLLFSTFALATCNDGIDNDGDGLTDLDDVGCLDSDDFSETVYGFQLQQDPAYTSLSYGFCLNAFSHTSLAGDCLQDHAEEMAWWVTFNAALEGEEITSCLTDYSEDYFGISFDASEPYTAIAVADCLHQHYDEYSAEYLTSLARQVLADDVSDLGEACLLAFFSEYESECASLTYCSDDADCASGETCNVDASVCESSGEPDVGVRGSCSSDADCSGGYACDTSIGECYTECIADSDCATEAACVTTGSDNVGQCVTCVDNDGGLSYEQGSYVEGVDYSTGEYVALQEDLCYTDASSDTYLWEAYCRTTSGNSYVFYNDVTCSDEVSGTNCVEDEEGYAYCGVESVGAEGGLVGTGDSCASDADCGDGYVCDASVGACYEECESNDQCSSDAACVTAGSSLVGECLVCTDSDGGQVLDIEGYVDGVALSGEYLGTINDQCASGTHVQEYYCESVDGYTYMKETSPVSCTTALADSGAVCSNNECALTRASAAAPENENVWDYIISFFVFWK